MKFPFLVFILGACSVLAVAQQVPQSSAPEPTEPCVVPVPPTEKIEAPVPARAPDSSAKEPGYMEPAQVKALLYKIWLTEFRVNDLLDQVRPEHWKISEATRSSFSETLENLRKALEELEAWRAQFEKRTDSTYLGFETYTAAAAVLPRLEGVTRSVTQYENASLGVQYSQAGNQLFDLRQSLEPYLSYLLHNQDQLLLAAQTNLAACQNQLGFAMHDRVAPATPMKNSIGEVRGRGRVFHQDEAAGSGKSKRGAGNRAEKKTEKKAEPEPGAAKQSSAAVPSPLPAQKK